MNHVIEHGLEGTGGTLVQALRGAADAVLRFLGDIVSTLEVPTEGLSDRIARCRADIANQYDARAIAEATSQCADAMQSLLAKIETEKTSRRREIVALIDLVRETMASIAGDAGAFDRTLGQSVDRFEAIGRLNNLQQVQARLTAEVKTLKGVAVARRTAWDSRFASFGQRIATLEDQLRATRQEATTDPLTQVSNRTIFDRTCREWTTASHLRFALALVHVDDLTGINNEFGIPDGDRVLVAVAGALKAIPLSADDVIARLGGGDFAVLAGDLTLAQLEARLRNVMSELSFGIEVAGHVRIKPTISCGTTDAAAGDTSASLVERASQALLEARRSGKNRIVGKPRPLIRDLLMRDLMRH